MSLGSSITLDELKFLLWDSLLLFLYKSCHTQASCEFLLGIKGLCPNAFVTYLFVKLEVDIGIRWH